MVVSATNTSTYRVNCFERHSGHCHLYPSHVEFTPPAVQPSQFVTYSSTPKNTPEYIQTTNIKKIRIHCSSKSTPVYDIRIRIKMRVLLTSYTQPSGDHNTRNITNHTSLRARIRSTIRTARSVSKRTNNASKSVYGKRRHPQGLYAIETAAYN